MTRRERILVIPDAHAEAADEADGYRRFALAGAAVAALKPSVVVCLGDWYDMPSLSSFDRGKKSFEGRRLTADLEAGSRALAVFDEAGGASCPRRVVTLGNHEHRLRRAAEDHAELDGLVGLEALDFARRGWQVVDYQAQVRVAGWHFSHCVPSGLMNRPIGGENAGRALIAKRLVSTVVGHSHSYDHGIRVRGDGRRVHGLVAGCWLPTDRLPSYAGMAARLWWSGLVLIHDAHRGDGDVEPWSIDRVERLCGSAL